MQLLRDHISQVDFSDAPSFADEVLDPLATLGYEIHFVCGFLPSYLTRVIELGRSDARSFERAKLNVTFCLPAIEPDEELENLIARHFLDCATSEEIFSFLDQVSLIETRRFPLSLQFLVPTKGSVITRSAIGVISDFSDQNDLVGFIDEFAGDNNSPIHLARTWRGDEAEIALRFDDLVFAAENDSWALVNRVRNVDFERVRQLVSRLETTTASKIFHRDAATEVVTNFAIEEVPNLSLDDEEVEPEEFDELMELIDGAQGDSEAFITMFYGDIRKVRDVHDFVMSRQNQTKFGTPHAEAIGQDLSEYIGDATNVCWCGNEYQVKYGCPGD